MKTKHTPGPWDRNIPPASKYPTIFAGRNTHIAIVISSGLSPEEVEGNANLIAAAPELLAALRDCVTEEGAMCLAYGTDSPKMRARLQAISNIALNAINKATGENAP